MMRMIIFMVLLLWSVFLMNCRGAEDWALWMELAFVGCHTTEDCEIKMTVWNDERLQYFSSKTFCTEAAVDLLRIWGPRPLEAGKVSQTFIRKIQCLPKGQAPQEFHRPLRTI